MLFLDADGYQTLLKLLLRHAEEQRVFNSELITLIDKSIVAPQPQALAEIKHG